MELQGFRGFGHLQKFAHLVAFLAREILISGSSDIATVNPFRKIWGKISQMLAGLAVMDEMLKRHEQFFALAFLICALSNPRQFALQSVSRGFRSYAPHTYDGIKIPCSHTTHAVVATEHSIFRVRVSSMRAFVNKGSHLLLIIYPAAERCKSAGAVSHPLECFVKPIIS